MCFSHVWLSNYLRVDELRFQYETLLGLLCNTHPCIQMRNTPVCFSPVGAFLKVILWRHLLVGTPITG